MPLFTASDHGQCTKTLMKNFTILRLLFVLRLMLGFYFRPSKSRLICYLTKMYCVAIGVCVPYAYFCNNANFHNPIVFSIVEFWSVSILCLISDGDSYFKYFNIIRIRDKIMGFKHISFLPWHIYLTVSGVLLIRVVSFCIRLSAIVSINFIEQGAILIVVLAVDINNIVIAIIFSLLCNRVKLLREYLQRNTVPVNIENSVVTSIRNIKKFLFNYEETLKSVFIINIHLQCLLTVCLLINIPKLVFLLNMAVKKMMKKGFTIGPETLVTAQTMYALCCPAILVELLAREVDTIKQILSTQFSKCSDEALRRELWAALEYVSLRPFRYLVARVVPLDAKLPFTVCSLAISYCIVLIQFTNFI